MNGIPLHPLVVHFPVVLVVILPIVAAAALWAIRRGMRPARVWSIPLVVAGALMASAYVALQTGEAQEDTVEEIVPEAALEEHEEAAKRFLVMSGILVLVMGTGLIGGTVGRAARFVAAAGSVGLIAAGFQVGRSGGELVYRHGAASAYAAPAAIGTERTQRIDSDHGEGDEEDAVAHRRRQAGGS